MADINQKFVEGISNLIKNSESYENKDVKLLASKFQNKITNLPDISKISLDFSKIKSKKITNKLNLENELELIKNNIDQLKYFVNNPHSSKLFSMPSLPIMFAILPVFSGNISKIPKEIKKVFDKPEEKRNQIENQIMNDYISENIIVEQNTEKTSIGEVKSKSYVAFVSDSNIFRATASIEDSNNISEETFSKYINRVFGSEGMRHLMTLLIAFEEDSKNGVHKLNTNDHLERMGYKREKSGAFNTRLKLVASDIIKLLGNLKINSVVLKNEKIKLTEKRLFTITQSEININNKSKNIISGNFEIRAENWWYKESLEEDNRCFILKDIVKENHLKHPITISLMPILSNFWTKSNEIKFTTERLMEWCNLEDKFDSNSNRKQKMALLKKELDYMKEKNYVKNWDIDDQDNINIEAPDWFNNKLFDGKKLPKLKKNNITLSSSEFRNIFSMSNLSSQEFSEKLGVSTRTIYYLLKGTKEPSKKMSIKIREVFPQ